MPAVITADQDTADALEHGMDYTGRHDLAGWHASEKFDGVRAYWDGRTLYSRTGRPCPLPAHQAAQLPAGVRLDCELYAGPGDAARQACAAGIRSGRLPITARLVVHDMPDAPGTYPQRMHAARVLLSDTATDLVGVAEVWTVTSTAHAAQLMRQITARGGEGLMLRAPAHRYTPGRTPANAPRLVKLKPDPDGMDHGIV